MIKFYVHKAGILDNRLNKNTEKAVLTAQDKDGIKSHGHEAIIYGQDGKPAAKFVYSPNDPLKNGVRLWLEAYGKVEVKDWNK